MPLKTKRWCDPADPDDGHRVLVCRYRPRALPKAKETWDVWMRQLGPSPELFDAFFGKSGGPPLPLEGYRTRYVEEMKAEAPRIAELAARLDGGESVTLLCSRDCILPPICHRTFLAELIERARQRR
jgi:uncharacterized protein YeaO (DUF488 family)